MRRLSGVAETLEAFSNEDLDPVEHAYKVLEEIKRWEPKINAFITLDSEEIVLDVAEEAARRWKKGEARPLEGVIVGVKDNISTAFMPTTAGSKMLDGYIPPYNATVIERLLERGAIIHGKLNLDEFAMGSTGEFSAFGSTRNPWDLDRVPGGSSSGSGACLAYGGCDAALGSDTGGSVRLPAAYTATVGLKPTYGLVSRYGLIPYGNSLDQISPMARSVRDVAILLEAIAGWDPLDATSLRVNTLSLSDVKPMDLGEARICIPEGIVEASEDPVKREFWRLLEKLESEGAVVNQVRLKWLEKALPAYYTIALAEAASNLARYDGTLYPASGESGDYWRYITEARMKGFGLEVKKRILMGVYVLSEGYRDEYYLAATKLRRLLRDELNRLLGTCILALPASPVLPPRLGERIKDPLRLYAMDAYTVPANLAGVPALVQPAGFSGGLPVGVQWIAGRLKERKLIELGLAVEEITGLKGVAAG